MGAGSRTREPLHPAVFGTVLLLLVSVGRLPELVPPLGALQLGNVAVVLGVFGLLMGQRKDDVPVLQTSMGKLLALFVLLAALSVGFSVWNSGSLQAFLTSVVTNAVMFYLVARTANSPRMLQIYAGTLVVSGAMLAFEAVAVYTSGRVQIDTAYDANDLAMVLVTILPLAVGGILARRGPPRWALACIAIVMLLTVLLTGSRGGILGLMAVVGYLLFARFPRPTGRRSSRGLSFGKVAVIAGGGILLVAAMPQFTLERMATLTNLESDYNMASDSGRIAIWTRGLEGMVARPWGHGIGTFGMVEMQQGGRFKAAHNIWIEVGVELGVAGVALLFGMFWRLARTATRVATQAFVELDSNDRAPPNIRQIATLAVALKGSLLGFFVTSMFLSAIHMGIIFALLALAAGLERQEWALAQGESSPGASGGNARTFRRGRTGHGAAPFPGRQARARGRSWTR
ncbi:MAG: O-antigen ligase family protein [Halofilum sp. (in: g-proteobacteria)]